MQPCLLHVAFKVFSACVVYSLVHVIFTLRVYALYDGSRRIAFIFGLVCAARLAVGVYDISSKVTLGIAHPHLVAHWFNHLCFPIRAFPGDFGIVFFWRVLRYLFIIDTEKAFNSSVEITTQFTLCYLTLRKTLFLEGGWSLKVLSIGSVLNRDALVAPLAFTAIFTAVITARPVDAALFIFPTLIAVPSCLACHTIVDLQRLGDEPTSEVSDEMIFSTLDNVWDSRTHTAV
ncbi:hypothetical protein E1B28_009416 [Marasmius oreades]|uniref:Uncharacterized protein n=1 Tax=Marasmius oreades TaxID=181124 RepID=A0A9P7S224_9AGAR|nr:uncharacterized protein E1B28_009416 [Marasmius oreades]KAG7093133.1 hypothetical protein E1B28_009416 [Marasmius oreades]